MPCISSVRMHHCPSLIMSPTYPHQPYANGFESLTSLALTTSFTSFITTCPIPTLRRLHIDTPWDCVVRPNQLLSLLKASLHNINAIVYMKLDLLNTDENTTQLPMSAGQVQLHHLEPLLHFPYLCSLEISHSHPFAPTDDDCKFMAPYFKNMEHLDLNCSPTICLSRPPMYLLALLPFASHCNVLSSLCIFLVNALDFQKLPLNVSPFQMLSYLHFGASPLGTQSEAGQFLSRLCPFDIEICSGVTWIGGLFGHSVNQLDALYDSYDLIYHHYLAWLRLQAIVNGFHEARRRRLPPSCIS
jgi:hypothetical protein